MGNDKNNILIAGNGASARALALKLRSCENSGNIFITNSGESGETAYQNIDIREDDLTGLLKFVLENDINMTIPISEKALKSDIVSFFQSNGQNIFGPLKKACSTPLSKILTKKFLYKIHAQTSKFGIFDRLQTALDYLKTAIFPVIISTENSSIICPTSSLANHFLTEALSYYGETDILIEEFVYGHKFSVYFMTDGYSAVPFATVGDCKYPEKVIKYFDIHGRYTPDFRISQQVICQAGRIVQNALKYFEYKDAPYVGILGMDCTLTGEDKFYVNKLRTSLSGEDSQAVLDTIEDDLIKIFNSCINGFFSDEYEKIALNNFHCVSYSFDFKSCTEISENILKNIDAEINYDNIQFTDGKYLINKNSKLIFTQKAGTISRAKELLQDDINDLNLYKLNK